jgi:steroid 5-alpha reductase family enzyme
MNFILLALLGLFLRRTFFTRQLILSSMVAIWGLRLAFFLFNRVLKRGRDERFDKIRINPVRFLVFFIIQMIWVWVVSLPVTLTNHQIMDSPITILDFLGWTFWV